ncbi:MAG TPA: sugar phosphate isomerase/epimerase family protein [Clostridia bacterium]|nr:sugar phosphate isomerase/epimerase family protein [Clostridia bacterium]
MIQTSLFIGTKGMPEIPCAHLYHDEIELNVGKAARFGFDAVEIIISDPETFDWKTLDLALKNSNIKLSCINSGRMALEYGLTLVHEDEKIRLKAFDKLKAMVNIAENFNCPVNIGLFRGRALEFKPISYTRDMFVEIMKQACKYAGQHNVKINFEPTNRFEINFINTTDDGIDIINRVGASNLGLLLDLYHIYIEDKSLEESIIKAKDIVRHFHFSDSDRWPAGIGHGEFDFVKLIKLLDVIGYKGFLSEGLVPAENVDECAIQTASFLKKLISQYCV